MNSIETLRALVDALDGAFISSWQSTAAWQNQLDAARTLLAEHDAKPAGSEQGEAVAWMHDEPGRVVVIHEKVRNLLLQAGESGKEVLTHYTIPLYTTPQPTSPHIGELASKWRKDAAEICTPTSLWDQGYAYGRTECADELEAATPPVHSGAVPEGYVLVPREPTEAMQKVGAARWAEASEDAYTVKGEQEAARCAWAAMLAASQQD